MKWWDPVIELMIRLKSNSLQLDSFVFFFLRHLIFFVCHTNRNSYFYCRKWFFFCCWCYFDCFVCSSCGSQWGRLISGCKWTYMALKIERWKHPLCYSYICFILLYVRLMYVMGEVALKLFFMYFLFISLSGRSRAGFIWWRRVSLLFHKRSERSILLLFCCFILIGHAALMPMKQVFKLIYVLSNQIFFVKNTDSDNQIISKWYQNV